MTSDTHPESWAEGAAPPTDELAAGALAEGAAGADAVALAELVGPWRPRAGLSGCVSKVTGGAAPSLVDRASYDGIPAYIIAVPTRVWVVGRGCTAADTQLIVQAPLKG